MPATNEVDLISLSLIQVNPGRQRKEVKDLDSLCESLTRVGLLNPIIITREFHLVAGERRFRAFQKLHSQETLLEPSACAFARIPCHYLDSLDPTERKIVELDENIRRSDITWQEQAQAVAEIHAIYSAQVGWTMSATASRIGLHTSAISRYLRITEEAKLNPKLLETPTMSAALNTISRMDERKADAQATAILDITKVGLAALDLASSDDLPEELPLGDSAPPEHFALSSLLPSVKPASESILIGDCTQWMSSYSGSRFNLLHCDFPYGIDYDGWDRSANHQGGYADSEDVYWNLLEALACSWDSIMAPSSHLVFWFSMHFYTETMEFFAKRIPQLTVSPFPLVWVKSDNKGTLPDSNRGARRIYETALFGSTGDRKIVRAVSNAYACPTNKSESNHISEKPEPMLKHFLSMLVDDQTRMLDPTCGGGSSLRAAESLKANFVLGIERDEGYANSARQRLEKSRTLSSLV